MFDIVIIGAGVIGLSIAKALGEKTKNSVLVVEKENAIGKGVSSRNSEVIHSGIYYSPGSLKSKYCVEGRKKLYDYCLKNDIWHQNCGKLVVGQAHQEEQLEGLYKNALKNGVDEIQIIDNQQISKISPVVDSSIALKVDCTGIVSAHDLMTNFYHKSLNYEHDYLFKAEVMGIEKKSNNFSIELKNYFNEIEKVESKWVINAAGLNSDIIGNFFDIDVPKLRFLKGSYFKLSSKWKNRFDRLIYPLPDAEHGSLGIHLTIDADGMARLGPDAEWCQNREENYSVDESLINTFYEEGKKYLPDLEIDDLTPDYSGIRPKIYLEKDSMPDFYISHEIDRGLSGLINLIGIESPGLTGSLAIGEDIAKMVIEN